MKYEYTSMALGELEANCYMIDCGGNRAAVVDPGDEPELILAAAAERGLNISAVLLTHGHFDHVGAARAVSEASGGCPGVCPGTCPVYLNSGDLDLPKELSEGLYRTADCSEGDVITVGEAEFKVMQTPGHSAGSVCYVCGELLFTGDTLFFNSRGRTDLPGGSPLKMKESLARLAALRGSYTVLPGHGPATSLGRERKANPFMADALRSRRRS